MTRCLSFTPTHGHDDHILHAAHMQSIGRDFEHATIPHGRTSSCNSWHFMSDSCLCHITGCVVHANRRSCVSDPTESLGTKPWSIDSFVSFDVRLRFCCPPPHVTAPPARSQSVHCPQAAHSQTLSISTQGSNLHVPISIMGPSSQARPPFLASTTTDLCRRNWPRPQVAVHIDQSLQCDHSQSKGTRSEQGCVLHVESSWRSASHCAPCPLACAPISRLLILLPPEQLCEQGLHCAHVVKSQSTSNSLHCKSSLHGLTSIVTPLHGVPPACACTAIARVLEWWPWQVAEHADHCNQSPKRQS
mmetsp:Transcript_54649/g.137983  ORF Transcript_54649/g.137983 Transcript_54649/m.137983 type:complete len:303 (+) Transcript_54649:2225-3133(+)